MKLMPLTVRSVFSEESAPSAVQETLLGRINVPSDHSQTKSYLLASLLGAIGGGLALYHMVVRPWQLRWGATPPEVDGGRPGEDLVSDPMYETIRAITIRAAAAEVWPWLVQIGYGRGGFYSYDWLENLAGLEIASADQIEPELQRLAVGDSVQIAPETALAVARLEPNRVLVLHNTMNPFNAQTVDLGEPDPGPYMNWTWAFILMELDKSTTRLIVRVRGSYEPRWLAPLFYALLEPVHFLMERKMMLGIKERAERGKAIDSFSR
jgi:hypothetical protein